MKVGVIDFGAGNLRSVEAALKYLKADYFITGEPGPLKNADKIIFPGVGEASSAMRMLDERSLSDGIRDLAASGKPLLGICIGCHILLERSEENNTKCLSLIPGEVKKFPRMKNYKIPHMGWNEVVPKKDHPLFYGIPEGSSFYFVHSYYPEVSSEEYQIGETEYGITFTSAFGKDNLLALQFHPEKSGQVGLTLLQNFLNISF